MQKLCPSTDAEGVERYGVQIISEGQVFDVGGRKLQTVHIPGHTSGSIGLIDEATGILLSADSVLKRMLIFQTRGIFLDGLKRLEHYDYHDILGAHWPEPLGRHQVRRAINLLEDYRPDMEVAAPWIMGGRVEEFRMFHRGTNFDDPEFVAFGYMAGNSIG